MRLTEREENELVRQLLDQDARGFPAGLSRIREMANILLAERNGGVVGTNWPHKFV